MAQTVEQLLSVTPLGSEIATITLNGDSGDVSAGAKSLAGSLRLSDGSGSSAPSSPRSTAASS